MNIGGKLGNPNFGLQEKKKERKNTGGFVKTSPTTDTIIECLVNEQNSKLKKKK